jgi:ABC-type multidrug transport system fused ATPase/permease subunit
MAMREHLRAVGTVVGLSVQAGPRASLLLLVLSIVRALAAPLLAVAAGALVDAAAAHDERRAAAAGLALAACTGGRWLLGGVATHVMARLQREVGFQLDCRLIESDARLPGLEHHERPDYLAHLDLLHGEYWQLQWALEMAVQGLTLAVQWAATAAVLLRLQPALLALPLCGLPSLAAAARGQHLAQAARERVVEEVRREQHLFDLGMSPAAGKEIRVFDLAETLDRRRRAAADAVIGARHRAQLAGATGQFLGQAAFTAGYVAAIALVAVRALGGVASAGDVVVVAGLAGQVGGLVGESAAALSGALGILQVLGRLRWLERYTESQGQAERLATPAAAPARLTTGIDMVGVSFRYPASGVQVLDGVDLYLPAGATVALVGENGAGKSTLVKLLCRFYEPTAGRITVDGADLARIDTGAWRRRMAGAFQDYARLELTVRETVGAGEPATLEQGGDGPMLAALERAGASDVLAALPRGLATLLGAGWEGGVDLSGGQWQKLALGRARMREQPLLLVLDEPTAALDPGAEHALFERFTRAAREVREHGGITLLVSHRFSTVRMADLIVVLDGQRVREVGTHDELMTRQGLYADLYTLQARAYAAEYGEREEQAEHSERP